MYCAFHYTSRPPRSAKKSRAIWDELVKAHGQEPDEIGLYISEGGFRDWHIRFGEKFIDIEDAIIGSPSLVLPEHAAEWELV